VSAPASIGLLQAHVAEIRKRSKSGRPIGFHVVAPWTGPWAVRDGDEELPVVYCPSPLAFRAELSRREPEGGQVVLLTGCNDQELGADVLSRLARQKLHRLEPWQALRERLGVQSIDPRLLRLKWLAEHLLALPLDALERPATQVLEADEVWQKLLSRIGFAAVRPDLHALLEWTLSAERLRLFVTLPPEPRDAYAARLTEPTGAAGAAILHLVAAGRGEDAVAAGLVCDAVFAHAADTASDAESARAAGRFEALLLGGATLEPHAGREWGDAATALLAQRAAAGEEAVGAWLDRAERLLRELKMEPLAAQSAWLPTGFEHRLAAFAAAPPEDAAKAAGRVLRHRLSPLRAAETQTVLMLLRLSGYLRSHKGRAEASSFAAATAAYAEEGAFADLARTALADAHHIPALATVRDQILRAAGEQRQAENRRFAELLAGWSEAGSATETLVPIESILDRVVAPLAASTPVLLLVLDGMSLAVFDALAPDLRNRGWEELRAAGAARSADRLAGIALLPTVTEVCRTSLLCGQRRRGNAAAESTGFAQHPGLRQQSTPARPPKLFHKGNLSAAADGQGLAEAVRAEIESTTRQVVGVVLNVVDDQLPKGSQLQPRWEIAAIRHLRELLQSAAAAGRAVVLTADHGHVVERESELRRRDGGGARYRPAPPPPGEGEVAVRGARVLAPAAKEMIEGNEDEGLVLAWSERLRYSAIQSGYHGGASPQEVVVPLSVWAPYGSTVAGWEKAALDAPAWWWTEEALDTPAAPSPSAVPPEPKPKPRRAKPAEPSAQTVLFAVPPAPEAAAPGESWLAALFASELFRKQLGRVSRQGITREQVAAALTALDRRGGRLRLAALAHQLSLSALSAQGLVATLQRVLNVEGFLVLSHDPDSDTVIFDRALLARQFPQERPA
jgi:hypothetical protein